MVVSKKYVFLLIGLLNTLVLVAQDFTGNWKSHFAYVDFVDMVVAGDRMYVASANTLFVHDSETNTNTEYTTVEGLSGEDISTLYYSAERALIIIGYKNGLVEIVDEVSGKVTSLVDIQNKLGLPPVSVKVNDFFEDENLLYIATGFGVVVFNLEANLFGDTFFISDSSAVVSDVVSVAVLNDTVFASIAGRGTFLGNKTDENLIEFTSWTEIQNDVFSDIQLFSGKAIAHNEAKSIYEFDGVTFKSVYTETSDIKDFEVDQSFLTVTLSDKVLRLTSDFVLDKEIEYEDATLVNKVTHSVFLDEEVYYTHQGIGFIKTLNQKFQDNDTVSPAGPLLNNIFSLDAFDGDLWMVYGSVTSFFRPQSKRLGVSRLRGGDWVSLPWSMFNVDGALNDISVLSSIKMNKQNKEQVFVGSFRRGGIYEINNAATVELFNNTNSNVLNSPVSPVFISAFTFDFDSNNELWFFNGELREGAIKRFRKDVNAVDSENSITINASFIQQSESISRYNVSEMIFDEEDNLYMASVTSGILAYQKRLGRDVIVSLPGESLELSFANSKALALDLNGDLWLGATAGLRIVENPERMFDSGNNIKGEPIIIEDEEAGGIPQELFFQQSISDIKVDANNNKWIAVSGGGVFYLSPDGQEVLLNFTKDNSPLPSNIVNDIAIDESTGVVFFATDKGLMEYNGGVTVAQENFEKFKIYPNPVRPEHTNVSVKIQGLTVGANVKITDIEGNLVYEVQNETFGGQSSGEVAWDTRSFSGKKVASGVYLVLVTGKEGEQTTIGKLLIVR
ncbi:type IX secretion system anionic LPS delivery protein PorZ [Aquimarina agarilytica]|uniref:type IX secretion system anionic LPS delivery protein PorZ n=1 Tax=Aquimarina agarilytica TaxID=1087449 RepID=UPI00028A30B7|nr:T9SS type A sorting domain-containing protein [Aquimarina agarilytica]